MIRVSCCMALLIAASAAWAQTEFSADIVEKGNSGGPSKVYFGKDKVRFESAETQSRGGGAFIMDLNSGNSIVLMNERHMYMEMPGQMMENRGMFRFFQTGDVENACADWLKLANNKGGTCHKVGSDTVNGRSTVKYEGTNSKGQHSTVWLDSKLRFPVKWEGTNEKGGELQNIKEGHQPDSLFEPPAGFTKMDMGNMGGMRRPN
jgi:hypothetical protein